MAEKKITKREKFEQIKDLLQNINNPDGFVAPNDPEMLVEFIDHEIELLARKGSKSATATPAQKDALAISEIVKDILAESKDSKGMTVGAILKDERIKSYVRHNGDTVSSQVITAIFTKNTKDFIRTVEKKVAYYSLNYGVEGEGEGE